MINNVATENKINNVSSTTAKSTQQTGVENNSVFNTEQTEVQTNLTPVQKLQHKIAELIKKYNLNIKAEEINAKIEKIANLCNFNINDLQKLTEEQANKIAEKVEKIINDFKKHNIELTIDRAFDALFLDQQDVTPEMYYKACKSGRIKPLRESIGIDKNTEVTQEHIETLLTDISKKIDEEIKNQHNLTEKEQKDWKIKRQAQYLAMLITATDEEDRVILVNILGSNQLANSNIGEFGEALASYAKDKEAVCRKMKEIAINELPGRVDYNGDVVKQHEIIKLNHICNNGLDNDAIMESHDEAQKVLKDLSQREDVQAFHEKYGDNLEDYFNRKEVYAVLIKLQNNEELNPEEAKIAKEIEIAKQIAGYTAGEAGIIPTLAERNEIKLLEQVNYDNSQHSFYKDIIKQVQEYANEYPDSIGMSPEEFDAIMDKVTNGNYSLIAENPDIPASELNTPKNPNASSTSDLGFSNTGNGNTTNLQALFAKVVQTENSEDNKFVVETKNTDKEVVSKKKYKFSAYEQYGAKGLKAYITAYGKSDFIIEAIKSGSELANSLAERIYKHDDTSSQKKLATGTLSYDVGKKLVDWMSNTARSGIVQMGTGALTKYLSAKQEEETKEAKV